MRRDRGEVHFKNIGANHVVLMQPWPQTFYVSRTMLADDAVEVRPLTVTGLVKGVARNVLTINLWRLCWLLRGLGFLKTEEACLYRWRDFTPCFWRYQQLRRFRWVRAADDYLRRAWREGSERGLRHRSEIERRLRAWR